MEKEGKLIVFEGIDGSGKTTVSKKINQYLNKYKIPSIYTKEPYDRVLESLVRGKTYCNEAGFHLFCADREQHIHDVIEPELKKGNNILCDRFIWSTWAYQIYGNCLHPDLFWNIANKYLNMPDLTIYLDCDPVIAKSRCELHEQDQFEEKDVDFFRRVTKGYGDLRSYIHISKRHIIEVNANLDEDYVYNTCLSAVIKVIKDE